MSNNELRRKLNRKRAFNYSREGWYFLTINTWHQVDWFGHVDDGKMQLNEVGRIAEKYLCAIPEHYHVSLSKHVVMPNHVHCIVWIKPYQINNIVVNKHCLFSDAQFAAKSESDAQFAAKSESDAQFAAKCTEFPAPSGAERTMCVHYNNHVVSEHCSLSIAQSAMCCPERQRNYGLISKIVKSFKNICTTEIRRLILNFAWQKSFYDRIIRTDEEAYFIAKYIDDNPANWKMDKNDLQLNKYFESHEDPAAGGAEQTMFVHCDSHDG